MADSTVPGFGPRRLEAWIGLRSDRALVARAADGSEAAFAAIFKRHHQALFRYAMSILGDRDDARDVVQETMAKLLRSLPGETREIELLPWLLRIAHNEAISLRRRPREAPLENVPEPESRESEPGGEQMRARAMLADLAELPDRQRSALVMRELNGLGYDEIGVALAVSTDAAKQAVYEARCALQELERGREMACDDVRVTISADDRRRLRGRKVRTHIRSCAECRAFQHAIAQRREDLGAIAVPAGLAAELLRGVLGSAGGSGGGGLGILGATATVEAAAGGAGVAKLAAGAVAVTVLATAVSVDVRSGSDNGSPRSPQQEAPPGIKGLWDGGSTGAAARERGPVPAAGRGDASAKEGGGDRSDGARASTGVSKNPAGSRRSAGARGGDPGQGPGSGNGPPTGTPAPNPPPGQPIAGEKSPDKRGGSSPAKGKPHTQPGLDKLPDLPKLPDAPKVPKVP